MASSKLTPISLKNRLAPTPKQGPRYAKTVRLQNGEEMAVADPNATRAMVAMMDMQAVLGGAASHWGGPSAFAELMSALHGLAFHRSQKEGRPWHELFHLINDAGHCENGLYALKANYGFADLSLESLKGFRSIKSQLTGHGESHLFPEGVYLSNGPLGSALPQSQGLAIADQLAGKKRITVTAISDGACMEGEAREALAAIPGLAAKGKLAPFVLVISDNNTKLSGRIDEQSFSMTPSFAALKDLGWNVLRLEDGHDLQACVSTLEKALELAEANPQQPVAIHARTVKGFGVKSTAQSSSGGHGFPLKKPDELRAFIDEIYHGESIPAEFLSWIEELENYQAPKKHGNGRVAVDVPTEKVQIGVANAMKSKFAAGIPVVSVTSDLPGSTGVGDFQKAYPEMTVDVGVAEANMVSTAAGLSKEGFVPVVDTFSQFGVTKGALPFVMANLSEAPMIAVFSHAGFQDAADGASHQALSYFAMAGAIPHTRTHCLTSSAEAEALVGQAIDEFVAARKRGDVPLTHIFFLGRENFPQRYLPEGYEYRLGRAQIGLDTSDGKNKVVTIVAAGPLFHQALEAAHTLKEAGIGAIVVNPSIINEPDVETLKACLKKSNGHLVTVEDHQVIGGMGAQVIHALVTSGVPLTKVKSLGVRDEFGQSAYQALELYQKHGLDAEAIVRAVKEL